MQWVYVTAESPSLRNLPYYKGAAGKSAQPLPYREALPILLWSGNKHAFCPGGRHYFCFSRLYALQTSLRRLSGVKAVTRQAQMLWELSPFPRATMMHRPVEAFRMSFKLNPLSSLWRLREHLLCTPFHARWMGEGGNVETCLSFSVLLYSHTCAACAGKHLKMHFSGNGSSHQTIEFCWFHLANISWIHLFFLTSIAAILC